MYKKKIYSKKTMNFKQWNNKPWSVFNSIGKIIRIALLPLSYFLSSVFTVNAQTDTIQIDDIEIYSSRVPISSSENARVIYIIEKKEIEELPANSLQDLIEYVCNADVRQRGSEGIQADISIRGGNYEQTLILLNGFKMNDVQTGHHNLNLPIDIESIKQIEIIQGPGNRLFGINAYSGAINFITESETNNKAEITLIAGQHKYFGGTANLSYAHKNWQNYLSVSEKTSEGYLTDDIVNNTDFNKLNLFYETAMKTKVADFTFQSGYSEKSFGANSFYTPAYPWQFENTKTIFAAFKTTKHGKKYTFLNSFYWRRHQDRFELFREDKYQRVGEYFIFENDTAPLFYKGHNYHKTNIIASELKLDFKTIVGKSALGTEYQHSFIQSNVLGELSDKPVDVPFEPYGEYTKEANRFNLNFYFEHIYKFRNLLIAGGFSANYNNQFNWNYSAGTDFSYEFSEHFKFFTSVNQAIRIPTYTDLYYQGPTNIGNPELLPEQALTYETGIKFNHSGLFSELTIFKRKGTNTIDRVRLSDTLKWQPMNITELNTFGTNISAKYNFANHSILKKLNISYAFTTIDKKESDYQSKYALDYLKHKIVFGFNHQILKNLTASWQFRYENRAGTYSAYDSVLKTYTGEQEYNPISLIDLKLMWKHNNYELFTEVNNLLNTEYFEFGNIKMPGLCIKAGLKFNFEI